MKLSFWKSALVGTVAWIFFSILLTYGYPLSYLATALAIRTSFGIGVCVVVLSICATVLGFFIGNILIEAFPLGEGKPRSGVSVSITLFIILQIIAFIPQLNAPGTPIYTIIELATSVGASSVVIWLLRNRPWFSTPTRRAITCTLTLISALALTFVTLSFASESGALYPSVASYVLYHSAYFILPLTLLATVIAYRTKSVRWAALGFIIAGAPLCLFYLIGLLNS